MDPKPRSELYARKQRIFDEGLKVWQMQLCGLQERLCNDLVNVALGNKEALGSSPLGWVRECIEEFWSTRREGFRYWVFFVCGGSTVDAIAAWRAPGWLLAQMSEVNLKALMRAFPLAESLSGELFEPYPQEILSSITVRIERSIEMAKVRVLDPASILFASQSLSTERSGDPVLVARINEAVQALSHIHGSTWNEILLESRRKLFEELDSDEQPERSLAAITVASEGLRAKGKRCHGIIGQIKKIKNMVAEQQRTVSQIRQEHPEWEVWSVADSLPESEDREIFNRPRQWGPPVGYALTLLGKEYCKSPHTIRDWVKAFRAENSAKKPVTLKTFRSRKSA
jgi:hypothetical protein